MKNLNDFLGTFKEGFQRSARFKCQIFLPLNLLSYIVTSALADEITDIIVPFGGNDPKSLLSAPKVAEWLARGLLCEATRSPSRALETFDQSIYGITERFPVHTDYTPLSCTFSMPLIGSDAGVPRVFSYWQNFIQDQRRGMESGSNFRFPSEYYGTILLSLVDLEDRPTITYQIEKVYPRTVESSQLSWEQNNEFMKLEVTFVYSSWKIVPYTSVPVF